MLTKEKLQWSIHQVSRWVEEHSYKGYEPFDGNSSFLHVFTFGNVFLERMLQQTGLRIPFNIRPLIGISPQESTKGRGYMAWGYLTMFKLTGEAHYRDRAVNSLEWLMENKAPSYSNYSWGNHFRFSSRGGRLPELEPIIVWTSLIGQAFLDAYEILKEEKYLEVAMSICEWILDLPREKTDSGACLSYVAFKQSSIHNSSMLGAAMLARAGNLTGNSELLSVAREAMTYSCSRQRTDGSWSYGEDPKYHWLDNFHTGYNLDSLKCYIDNTGDLSFEDSLQRGYRFFKETFFEQDGRPKYFHNRTYPIDIQCAAQGIDTLAYFSDYDETSLAFSEKVAHWTLDNMQSSDGHFYYRDWGWIKVKTPMLHWGQATMFKALTHLLSKRSSKKVILQPSVRLRWAGTS